MKQEGRSMRQASGRRPSRGGRHNNSSSSSSNGRSPRGGGVSSLRHQNFDSNGPEVRVRGNAKQVYEKYLSLARDARGTGDHVLAENLMQHAEHYYRIVEAIEEAAAVEQRKYTPSSAQFGDEQPDMPDNYYTPEGSFAEGQQDEIQLETDSSVPRRGRPARSRGDSEQKKDHFMLQDAGDEEVPQHLAASGE